MGDTSKKTAFKIGILLGITLVIISSIIHLVDLNLITNIWLGIANVTLNIVFGIISIILVKKILNGFITFKEAFTAYFITLLAGSVISTFFIIVFYNFVISSEELETIKDIMINFNLDMMKNNNSPTKAIEDATALSKDYDPANFGYIIKSSLYYLLRDCIIGFLVALAFRNKLSN